MKIVWSPLALELVEDLAQYIAEDKPDAAAKWVEGLFATVERLADFPESGRMVPEVESRRIREVVFGTYRVIYSVKEQIDILTVRRSSQLSRKRAHHHHGAQDCLMLNKALQPTPTKG